MNRSDLVELLTAQFSQFTQHDIDCAVTAILDEMTNAMVREHRIELRGFGSFSIMHRASRMGRNPRSGATVVVPAKKVVHFKPGKALREAVNPHSHERA
ncbi:integration host factor subunit beta [Rhodoferax sp. TS-BS-61-7]|uniref:integration host factor subunit beta n=1 Tax=Rhodoferax sp. TS-BS-61-7 TaxID=2094194 RepID=UPI000CF68A7E|nr:integration host factor subunit beta [Rhodoferax sp. TS-BS-61-7]PQA75944.1 integration host factor subunit beta [Rhodoferax sp. TS-BS-61-7]